MISYHELPESQGHLHCWQNLLMLQSLIYYTQYERSCERICFCLPTENNRSHLTISRHFHLIFAVVLFQCLDQQCLLLYQSTDHFGMTKSQFQYVQNLICETCSYKRLAIKTTSVSAESNFGLHCLNRYSLFIKLEMFPNIPLLVLLGKG